MECSLMVKSSRSKFSAISFQSLIKRSMSNLRSFLKN